MMIPLAMPNLTGHEKEYLDNCIDNYVCFVNRGICDKVRGDVQGIIASANASQTLPVL